MINLRDSTGRSLYFSDRKEYYRRKRISASLKERARRLKEEKIFFVNFVIEDSNGYVQGSLSSSKIIELSTAKEIIRANLPTNYIPIEFYTAEESGHQEETLLIVLREDEEIINEVINV